MWNIVLLELENVPAVYCFFQHDTRKAYKLMTYLNWLIVVVWATLQTTD